MASKLAGLSSLKLAQLKRVAFATGINSSGTKTDLTTRLQTELHDAHHAHLGQRAQTKQGQRIVSIDMGIRNLAYCVLAVPSRANIKPSSPLPPPPPPVVEAWTRLDVAVASKPPPPLATVPPSNAAAPAPHPSSSPTNKATPRPKEAFDPATYARHAYSLISTLVRTHQPSTILIERQRYRSMGGAAVQEWTLRVNMFEAMLHAVLETLGREGSWAGEVWAVSPGKVASFAGLDRGGERKEEIVVVVEGGKKKKKKKRGIKGVKIDVVGGWLVGGGIVGLQGQAEGMGRAFLKRWKGEGRRKASVVVGDGKGGEDGDRREDGGAGIGKLDDLADCLLQGVAWVKWQENKRLLLDGGVDSLDEVNGVGSLDGLD